MFTFADFIKEELLSDNEIDRIYIGTRNSGNI